MWFLGWRALAGGLLVALALAAPVGATPAAGTTITDSLDNSIVAQINVVRRSHGLSLLRANSQLHRSASGHSHAMGTYGFFSHESRDGTVFWKRVKRDYSESGFRTWTVGETLAFSAESIDAGETVRMWMNSPLHRKVLLTPAWRDVGISAIRVYSAPGDFDGDDVTLVTADFGFRR